VVAMAALAVAAVAVTAEPVVVALVAATAERVVATVDVMVVESVADWAASVAFGAAVIVPVAFTTLSSVA
jgi:hypothetical protein